MLLGRLRRTACEGEEDCSSAWAIPDDTWGAWAIPDDTWGLGDSDASPEAFPPHLRRGVDPPGRRPARVAVAPVGRRGRRRGAAPKGRCRPDANCLCCSGGLLLLIVFAVLARQIVSRRPAGLHLRGTNETGWTANFTENGSIFKENFTSGGFAHGDSISMRPDDEEFSKTALMELPENATNDTTDDLNTTELMDSDEDFNASNDTTDVNGSEEDDLGEDSNSSSELRTATTASLQKFEFRPSGPLSTMPNCFLAPLVEKPGCKRISVEEGQHLGLNELGQETTARRLCMERARQAGGNTWVFRLLRCEVWHCDSKEELQRSADSGPPENSVVLQDHLGRLLATSRGQEVVVEDSFVSSLALVLEPEGRLRSADGHYVVVSSGSLEATGNWETAEVFSVWEQGGGWVSLHSSSGNLQCTDACTMSAEGGLFKLVESQSLPEAFGQNSILGRAWVHSSLCNYQEPYGGEGGRQRRSASYVKLWEWNYVDVARECREVLGPMGYDAVQLSPVTEHILGHEWWVRYQPVSASLTSRSGSAEELRDAVAECRRAGVEVIVDVVLNHMARPCAAAQNAREGVPCVGWNGTSYGNRRTAGARGWDAADPLEFHHGAKETWGACGVGPDTGFLCGSPVMTDCSCCPCDMYGLPDWDLATSRVQESHTRHLEELHRMGVTMLRIDAALYMEPELMSGILNRFPWDVVYQEWWHELPVPGRTEVFGLYRDLKFMRRVAEFLDVLDISRTHEVLDVDRGDFYIHPDEAVFPTCFHDGRSDHADPATPTFKNGLAFHQQQLFMLASPFPVTVVLWGGYAWRSIDDGPPGCEDGSRCWATSPWDDGCMATPTAAPLGPVAGRPWVCEHRWQGLAGLLRFRQQCRGPETQRWTPGGPEQLAAGHFAFRLGSSCFVAVARGSNWSLAAPAITTGLPKGRYCDLGSFDGRTCHREVLLDQGGRVLEGGVAAGGLLAISAAVMQPG